MRSTNVFTTELVSAYEHTYCDLKEKELKTLRNALVQHIKSHKELLEEFRIDVGAYNKITIHQVINELKEQGILARPEEKSDSDDYYSYIANIVITTKSLDDLIERSGTSISKNLNGFFNRPSASSAFTTELISAYEQLVEAYRKLKEKELKSLRDKLVQNIKSRKELTEEFRIDVEEFSKKAIQQVINELNESGIVARPEEKSDSDDYYSYIANIVITTKSLDELIKHRQTPVSKNQSGPASEQSDTPNQNIASISPMRKSF